MQPALSGGIQGFPNNKEDATSLTEPYADNLSAWQAFHRRG